VIAAGAGLARLRPLLDHPRYEVFPAGSIERAVLDWVPRDITVTVTASAAKGLEPTLDLTARLAAHGYQVVPHLPARLVRDDAHLTEIVGRLRASGVTDVFVPAGDADPPAGRFGSAVSLLDQLAEMGRPFPRVGVTGHPHGHPHGHPRLRGEAADQALSDQALSDQALWDKRHHASYVVSNLCLDPAVLRRWITRVRARGLTLPLYVGVSGPVDRARLLRMAARAGVAGSARFLAGHTGWFLRVGTPGGYRPDRLLDRTATTLTDPASAVAGLHIFTFNQVQRAEQWRSARLIGSGAVSGPPSVP
jgi:methylenetetrahydrofolate reductase (NADPH)